MTDKSLTHLNERGEAHMVDVGTKDETERVAVAEGFVSMEPQTLALIEKGDAKKGDVLATARIAGIMAAKNTHNLIPLGHPLAFSHASVEFKPSLDPGRDNSQGRGQGIGKDRRGDGGVDRGLCRVSDDL